MKSLTEARVAVVNEWLGTYAYGGAEKVLEAVLEIFPQADLFATIHDPEPLRGTPLEGVAVNTSFLQSLPGAKRHHRAYLPLMPLAVEQFDLRSYDLILSLNHAVAKGVLTRADQLHISYVYTPLRYAWDLHQDYLAESSMSQGFKSWLARAVLHYVRIWDVTTVNRVDAYLTLSHYVARRIWRSYRRPARVIYPPVDVERYRHDLPREDFYVSVSRLTPYKRVDLIVNTFNRLEKPLVVIGDGPELERLRSMAGPNVRLLGRQPEDVLTDHLQRAGAFVFAAEEDFGIAPVEAQAAGCPVIAYGKGGARETVVSWPEADATGVFFEEQTPESLMEAVKLLEARREEFDPQACRRNAERFGRECFRQELLGIVEELWEGFRQGELPE